MQQTLSKFFKPASKDDVDVFTKIPLSEKSWVICGKIPQEIIPDFNEMLKLRPASPDTVIMMGNPVLTPRFVAHYLKSYYYTGRVHDAKPLPDILFPLMEWANTVVLDEWKNRQKHNFNQVLVNYYLNGMQYIGKHSDDERQLVSGSPIFSASFGQSRVFRIRDKSDDSVVQNIQMSDGTFLLMCGDMQKEFKHEVPKVQGKKGLGLDPRINVTFRVFK